MTPYLPSFFYSNSGMLKETDIKEDNIPPISTHTYNPDEIVVRFKSRIVSLLTKQKNSTLSRFSKIQKPGTGRQRRNWLPSTF